MHSTHFHRFGYSDNLLTPANYISRQVAFSPVEIPAAEPMPLVSAIIPCLNEEITLAICIKKVTEVFTRLDIQGEIIIGDNGSTDQSVEIAKSLGARVIHQSVRSSIQ